MAISDVAFIGSFFLLLGVILGVITFVVGLKQPNWSGRLLHFGVALVLPVVPLTVIMMLG